MKAIRQRIFACILAVLFITVMASGGKKEVKAAERAGDAGTNKLVVYFSCTENTKTVAEHAAYAVILMRFPFRQRIIQ